MEKLDKISEIGHYRVPSSKGGYLNAEPIQFCLKYKPPTIAIVYEIVKHPRNSIGNNTTNATQHSPESPGDITMHSGIDSPSKKKKKHIHEIRVDDLLKRESAEDDLSIIADKLFERECLYLDSKIISK